MQTCPHVRPGTATKDTEIRCMRPEDACGVPALMREVYGETYPKKLVYDPVLLRKKTANGEIFPVIAAGPTGNVIGYAALSAYYGYPEIGLLGTLAVSPACRGRGLGGKLHRHLISCGMSAGFVALSGGAFTSHPFSQKILEQGGFCPTAILLGSQPQSISFHGIAETLGQRESVAFYTRLLAPQKYGIQYLPASHHQVITEICRDIGLTAISERPGHSPVGIPSVCEELLNADNGAGLIWMRIAGDDCREVLGTATRRLRSAGAKVLRLHLNLNDPGSPSAVQVAEKAGFVFAGILPGKDGIILLMQNLLDIALDPEKLCLTGNPAGSRLLAYIGMQVKNNRGGTHKVPQAL